MSRPRFEMTAEHVRLVQTAAGLGLTEAMIARLVGCSPRTFRTKKGLRPDVLAALERGQALAAMAVAKALYNKAIRGDVSAIIWFERTRQNRSEITRHEHSGPNGAPVAVTLTPQERRERVEAILGRVERRMAKANGHANGNGHARSNGSAPR